MYLLSLDPIRSFKGLVEGNDEVEKVEGVHVVDCDVDDECEDKVERNTSTHTDTSFTTK